MAKLSQQEIKRMAKAPCYPGTRLLEQEDGSYLVVPVACPSGCNCPNRCDGDGDIFEA